MLHVKLHFFAIVQCGPLYEQVFWDLIMSLLILFSVLEVTTQLSFDLESTGVQV